MAFELVYTSVPRGIRQGSTGFCIVAYTNGLAANIALQLESLSAYKPYFPHYDENAPLNPVAFSHYLYTGTGEELHILSRTCFYGLDYTRRSNKLAHHLVLRAGELSGAPSGPGSVFRQTGLFRAEWNEEPQLFPQQREIKAPVDALHQAITWQAYAGDAGWAGVLAQHFLNHPDKTAFITFDPLRHTDTLALVEEALLLLPPKARWKVSFNTYFCTLPAGIQCNWRFCVPGSEALKEARRTPGSLLIDLTQPLSAAEDGRLQQLARTGLAPQDAPRLQIPPRPPSAGASLPNRADCPPLSTTPMQSHAATNHLPHSLSRSASQASSEPSSVKKILGISLGLFLLLLLGGGYRGIKSFRQIFPEALPMEAVSGSTTLGALEKEGLSDLDRTPKEAEARRQEEDKQVAAARQKAEELKKAEPARKQEEAELQKAEAARKQKEAELQKAEAARKQKEAELQKAEAEKKQKAAELKNEEIIANAPYLWLDGQLANLAQPGSKAELKNMLCENEKVISVKIGGNEVAVGSDGIIAFGGKPQYRLSYPDSGTLSIATQIAEGTASSLQMLTTDRERKLYLIFELKKCMFRADPAHPIRLVWQNNRVETSYILTKEERMVFKDMEKLQIHIQNGESVDRFSFSFDKGESSPVEFCSIEYLKKWDKDIDVWTEKLNNLPKAQAILQEALKKSRLIMIRKFAIWILRRKNCLTNRRR